mmetsp:Transcript_27099/g.55187  ORF Transcript_27099/g.55187 Transcript_27099/m.55187 type:complete len:258 (+) Transcript_27099:439-1212(+)
MRILWGHQRKMGAGHEHRTPCSKQKSRKLMLASKDSVQAARLRQWTVLLRNCDASTARQSSWCAPSIAMTVADVSTRLIIIASGSGTALANETAACSGGIFSPNSSLLRGHVTCLSPPSCMPTPRSGLATGWCGTCRPCASSGSASASPSCSAASSSSTPTSSSPARRRTRSSAESRSPTCARSLRKSFPSRKDGGKTSRRSAAAPHRSPHAAGRNPQSPGQRGSASGGLRTSIGAASRSDACEDDRVEMRCVMIAA